MLLDSVLKEFQLEQIWVIPSKHPPGKTPVASFEDRYQWTKKTFSSSSKVSLSKLEASASQTLFAKDLIYQIQADSPGHRYFWILGEDQWQSLQYWNSIDQYALSLEWIVIPRDLRTTDLQPGILSRRLLRSTCSYYWARSKQMPEVSSTQIRFECRSDKPSDLVEPTIKDEVFNFYRNTKE